MAKPSASVTLLVSVTTRDGAPMVSDLPLHAYGRLGLSLDTNRVATADDVARAHLAERASITQRLEERRVVTRRRHEPSAAREALARAVHVVTLAASPFRLAHGFAILVAAVNHRKAILLLGR